MSRASGALSKVSSARWSLERTGGRWVGRGGGPGEPHVRAAYRMWCAPAHVWSQVLRQPIFQIRLLFCTSHDCASMTACGDSAVTTRVCGVTTCPLTTGRDDCVTAELDKPLGWLPTTVDAPRGVGRRLPAVHVPIGTAGRRGAPSAHGSKRRARPRPLATARWRPRPQPEMRWTGGYRPPGPRRRDAKKSGGH